MQLKKDLNITIFIPKIFHYIYCITI